jgi:hypothetical protein
VVCAIDWIDHEAVLSFHIGLRHHMVESMLAHYTSSQVHFNQSSHTLMVSWHQCSSINLPRRVVCSSERELIQATDLFMDFMDRDGFNTLDKYKSLRAADELLNDHPLLSSNWCNHSWQRCFRGMTTAKLLNRNDYERLFQMHQQYLLQRGAPGQIIEKFSTIFARLHRLSLN